jgi:tRNA G10  N-methylase Trm11
MTEFQKYICVLAFGELSLFELARLRDSGILDFKIVVGSKSTAALICTTAVAKQLAKRAGGIYKIGRICGETPDTLAGCLPLPDSNKFNWTISSYQCTPESLEETKDSVAQILREASLGKARFVSPDYRGKEFELRLSDLLKNILVEETGKKVSGLDIIVDCSLGSAQYGYTEFPSDVESFRERDLNRPYQDPTVTLGPRLARTLVNLLGLPPGKIVLDPFCGLGTILQEGLSVGLNVKGIDISSTEITKCRENLEWFRNRFKISSKLFSKVIRGDSLEPDSFLDLARADAIATEPILVPKLERNLPAEKTKEIISVASSKYSAAFRTFASLLKPGDRVSIVAPELIDDRGKGHSIDLRNIAPDYGFVLEQSSNPRRENPCSVPTTKKKIIRRQVYLWRYDPKVS